MKKDLAFLILKNSRLFTFPYDISHTAFLAEKLGIDRTNVDDYIESETIVGVINENYIEIRIRGYSDKSLNSLFKFLCDKSFLMKKVYMVFGNENKSGYLFDSQKLNDTLEFLDKLIENKHDKQLKAIY